ncbi:MAG: type II toxin-antitoxin system RelE/ParE family toxin [Bacteroidetes bacterium]|nr:type II toxin-antitoxin system RelE/ParE family toxin [Bacteroidota bacterium]
MRVIIEDEYLEYLYVNGRSKGKPKFSFEIERTFIKRVIQISSAQNSNDLRAIKSLHFEKLSGDYTGKYSIRVNDAFRIILRLEKEAENVRVEIICIEELSNHYQ